MCVTTWIIFRVIMNKITQIQKDKYEPKNNYTRHPGEAGLVSKHTQPKCWQPLSFLRGEGRAVWVGSFGPDESSLGDGAGVLNDTGN